MPRSIPAALLALCGLAAALAAAPGALRVKASPAVAPCAAAAAAAFQKATGTPVSVETAAIGMPESAAGADVIVAVDAETHRLVEGGLTDPTLEADVARIPWVLAGAAGSGADLRALGRGGAVVHTLDGVAAREAWRRLALRGVSPERVERHARGPVRLPPGENAILPLSLAPEGPVSTLDLPPLIARVFGVRASPRPAAAAAFVAFLTGEAGNTAFRACGREERR
jgi:hypothetical protein